MATKKKYAKPYVIVRTYSAGVFAGTLESRKGKEVVLTGVRRLWYWAGAASLSQLAMTGPSKPESCKFPVEVERIAGSAAAPASSAATISIAPGAMLRR
jgi:hypothetical protein